MTKAQIRQQPIWLNSNLRVDNKPICNSEAIRQGILLIGDIIQEDGYFCAYDIIKQKSNNAISFLQYFAICDNVNPCWKQIMRRDGPEGNPSENVLSKILHEDHVPHMVYNDLCFNPYAVEQRKLKWENSLGIELDMPEFNKLFANIYHITNVSKYQSFQYRLFMRTIVLNEFLCYCKIRLDNYCSFCSNNVETLQHFFSECEIGQEFLHRSNRIH